MYFSKGNSDKELMLQAAKITAEYIKENYVNKKYIALQHLSEHSHVCPAREAPHIWLRHTPTFVNFPQTCEA